MNIEQYRRARELRLAQEKPPRPRCGACHNPPTLCYCHRLQSVESLPDFVILIHRGEARRSIASGRMAHLHLSNSFLFEGLDFTEHEGLNRLLRDPTRYPVLLYPGWNATDLTPLSVPERRALFPEGKRPLVILIDGTWGHAKRMRRFSKNLHSLPAIAFKPSAPSIFRVRRQPKADCLSTLEAAHHLMLLLGYGDHRGMLDTFEWLVDQHAGFMPRRPVR